MRRCDAIAWAAGRGGCDGCGKPLTGRQRRWCSDGCDDLYWSNHRYTRAREAALARAQVYRHGWREVYDWATDRYTGEWRRATHPAGYRCERCHATTRSPEVNHRTPALGAHNAESCVHHQENLEVLCRDCHLAETRRQHAAGELGHTPRPRPAVTPPLFEVAS